MNCISTFRRHENGTMTPRYNGFIIACLFPNMTSWQPLSARSFGLFLLVSLAACSFVEDPVSKAMKRMTPYRAEVVKAISSQGAVAGLATWHEPKTSQGNSRHPLIASVFHANRWDYAFTIKRQGTAPQQRKLSVFQGRCV